MSQAKVDRYKEEKANRKKWILGNDIFAPLCGLDILLTICMSPADR